MDGKKTKKTQKNIPKKSKKNVSQKVNIKLGRAQDVKILSAPNSLTSQNLNRGPRISRLSNGDCRIIHREYLQDVTSEGSTPSLFSITSISINPGLQSIFQWLYRVAQNYESYRFNSLKVHYQPMVGTSASGLVMIGLDYDAADPIPTDKSQLLNSRSTVSVAPWAPVKFVALSADLHKAKSNYVRVDSVPSGKDVRLYDIGNLYIATKGCSPNSLVGEIFIEYDITLMTPAVLVPPVSIGGSVYGSGAGATPASPFGSAPTVYGGGFTFPGPGGNTITLTTPGTYFICTSIYGSGIIGNPTLTCPDATATLIGQTYNSNYSTAIYSLATAIAGCAVAFSMAGKASGIGYFNTWLAKTVPGSFAPSPLPPMVEEHKSEIDEEEHFSLSGSPYVKAKVEPEKSKAKSKK